MKNSRVLVLIVSLMVGFSSVQQSQLVASLFKLPRLSSGKKSTTSAPRESPSTNIFKKPTLFKRMQDSIESRATGIKKQLDTFAQKTQGNILDKYKTLKQQTADYTQQAKGDILDKYKTLKRQTTDYTQQAKKQFGFVPKTPTVSSSKITPDELKAASTKLKKVDTSNLEKREKARFEQARKEYVQDQAKKLKDTKIYQSKDQIEEVKDKKPAGGQGGLPPRVLGGLGGIGMMEMGTMGLQYHQTVGGGEEESPGEPEQQEPVIVTQEPEAESIEQEPIVVEEPVIESPIYEKPEVEQIEQEPVSEELAVEEPTVPEMVQETPSLSTSESTSILDIPKKSVKIVTSVIKGIPGAIKTAFNNMTYDKDYLKLSIEVPDLLNPQKKVEVGIQYNFGFAGAGLEEDHPPLESGFPMAKMDIMPEKLFGVIPTRKLLLGQKSPITGKRSDLASKVLRLLPEELQTRMNKMLDEVLEASGDTVFVFKTFMLLNTIRVQVASNEMTLVDATRMLAAELPFLLARLTYTEDVDATKKVRAEARALGKNPMLVPPIMFTPMTPLNRFKEMAPEIGNIIDTINNSIKFPIGRAEYDEYRLRIATNTPPTPLEKAVANVRNTVFITGYLNRLKAAIKDLLPLITSSLDVVDRRLLVKALHSFVIEFNAGVDADDADQLPQEQRDQERRMVLTLRSKVLTDLLTQAIEKMENAGFDQIFISPLEEDLEHLDVQDVLTLFDLDFSPFTITEEPVQMTLIEIIDMRYGQFIKNIVHAKIEGHPDYIDYNFKLSDAKAIERVFAVGFWVIGQLKKARSAYVKEDADAKRIYQSDIIPLQQQIKAMQERIKGATSKAEQAVLLGRFKELKESYRKNLNSLTRASLNHVYQIYEPTTQVFEGQEIKVGGLESSILGVVLTELARVYRRVDGGLLGQLKGVISQFFTSALGIDLDAYLPDSEIQEEMDVLDDLEGDVNFDDFEDMEDMEDIF